MKNKIILTLLVLILISGCIGEQEPTCQNECLGSACENNAFYYCEDIDNDGCTEKNIIRYCGSDFSCSGGRGSLVCTSPTKSNSLKMINGVKNFENIEGIIAEKGTKFSNDNCIILEVYKDSIITSCGI